MIELHIQRIVNKYYAYSYKNNCWKLFPKLLQLLQFLQIPVLKSASSLTNFKAASAKSSIFDTQNTNLQEENQQGRFKSMKQHVQIKVAAKLMLKKSAKKKKRKRKRL